MSKEFDPYQKWLGIPPNERPCNYYRLLGLELFESDRQLIVQANDQRTTFVRTFQTGPKQDAAQEILTELAQAASTLLNEERKTKYDDELRAQQDAGESSIDDLLPTSIAPTASSEPVESVPSNVDQFGEESTAGSIDESDVGLPPTATATAPANTATATAPASPQSAPRSTLASRHKQRGKSAGWLVPVLVVLGVAGAGVGIWFASQPATSSSGSQSANNSGAGKTKKKSAFKRKPKATRKGVKLEQEATGTVNLSSKYATLHGQLRLRSRDDDDLIADWDQESEWAEWKFRVFRPGMFTANITYTLSNGASDVSYQIRLNGETIKTMDARSGDKVTDEVNVLLKGKGEYTLQMRPASFKNGFLSLYSIELKPQGS